MSTFGGKIQEVPGISVDRFDSNNLDSEAYFLSHCHSDHMVGLCNFTFQAQLVENNKYLYASQISQVILAKMYPYIENNIKVLHLDGPSIIPLKNTNISVTLIPAGHCPGSVMFLFECENTILYTGDYRINKNDIRKFRQFYNAFNEVKIIDKLYLDTTFFLKTYLNFPKREESLSNLCEIIEEWINRGKQFLVRLQTCANYGYEYAFTEIFKRTKMPIHVNERAYEFYALIPEMDKSVTTDGSVSQIHSNCGATFQAICDFSLDSIVKTVKVSAFRWTEANLKDGLSLRSDFGDLVCYSTHASYEEGAELIRFLKPKAIEACVKHTDPYVNREMNQLIVDHLLEFEEKKVDVKEPKLFTLGGSMQKAPRKDRTKPCDDTFGVLESPPKETKFRWRAESLNDKKCIAAAVDDILDPPQPGEKLLQNENRQASGIEFSINLDSTFAGESSSSARTENVIRSQSSVILDDLFYSSPELKQTNLGQKSNSRSKSPFLNDYESLHKVPTNPTKGAEKSEKKAIESVEKDVILSFLESQPSTSEHYVADSETQSADIENSVILSIIEFSPPNKRTKS